MWDMSGWDKQSRKQVSWKMMIGEMGDLTPAQSHTRLWEESYTAEMIPTHSFSLLPPLPQREMDQVQYPLCSSSQTWFPLSRDTSKRFQFNPSFLNAKDVHFKTIIKGLTIAFWYVSQTFILKMMCTPGLKSWFLKCKSFAFMAFHLDIVDRS